MSPLILSGNLFAPIGLCAAQGDRCANRCRCLSHAQIGDSANPLGMVRESSVRKSVRLAQIELFCNLSNRVQVDAREASIKEEDLLSAAPMSGRAHFIICWLLLFPPNLYWPSRPSARNQRFSYRSLLDAVLQFCWIVGSPRLHPDEIPGFVTALVPQPCNHL